MLGEGNILRLKSKLSLGSTLQSSTPSPVSFPAVSLLLTPDVSSSAGNGSVPNTLGSPSALSVKLGARGRSLPLALPPTKGIL
jgi:hypothetical protein